MAGLGCALHVAWLELSFEGGNTKSVERKNSYGSAAATPTPRSNAPLKGFPMPARQPAARCGPGRFRAWGEHQRH
eukprot:scaffold126357_cov60-Phaeocystis_antarctica.AAC.1